jgi:pimeloyl-ACP methyl ester carboxylesterase
MNYGSTLLALLLLMSCHAAIHAQTGVKTKDAVPINGIKQWIVAEGKDDTKPILLFLHGGPGFPSRPYANKFVKLLRKDFVVVQWDQRASGLTEYFSPNSRPLNLEQFHQDTYEVVEYLRKRFSRDKIFLAGFSWGGFLGWRYAHDHPEKLHAYIAVSSMIHNNESEERTLTILREKAKNNPSAIEELKQISIPFPSWKELYYQRKWTSGLIDGKPYKGEAMTALFEKWAKTWFSLFKEASTIDYRKEAAELACPVHFFQSKRDYVANHTVTTAYFDALQAPEKSFVWFYESSHEIPSDEPKKFSEELIKISKLY